jgi:tetratricopeptide (TPR) repeat protein
MRTTASIATVAVLFGQSMAALPQEGNRLEDLLESARYEKQRGEWEQCIELLRAAAGRADENPALAALAQCRIGECYISMALPEKAEAELSLVLSRFPGQLEEVNWARVALMDALCFQGKHEAALQVFADVRAGYSEGKANALQLAWSIAKAGGILKDLGRRDDALLLLGTVDDLQLEDRGPEIAARLTRCEVLMSLSRYDEALEPLENLVTAAAGVHPENRT